MLRLIVFTTVLTAGALMMSAAHSADEVQSAEGSVERAMNQSRTMVQEAEKTQAGQPQGSGEQRQMRYRDQTMQKDGQAPGYGQGGRYDQGYGQGGRYGKGPGYGRDGGQYQQGPGYGRGGGQYQQGPGYGRDGGQYQQGPGYGRGGGQ